MGRKGATVESGQAACSTQHAWELVVYLHREIAHLEIPDVPGASSLSGLFGDTHPMTRHRVKQWKMKLLAWVHLHPEARLTQLALNQEL